MPKKPNHKRCEHLLKAAERILRDRQIATYWKIPNDLRLTADEVFFGDRGPCDFFGHTARGTAILLEAKSTRDPRLQCPHPRGIKGHQWMALRDAHSCGAHALIAWLHDDAMVVMTWEQANELLGTRRSIPWPGGVPLSLQDEEATVQVVGALIEVLDFGS